MERDRTCSGWNSPNLRFFSTIILLFMLLSVSPLSASGRNEEPAMTPVNAEYVFCVTSLNISALPLSRQVIGSTVTRNLAATLTNLDFRFRGEEESVYYRDYAWAKSRAAAAKALAAKRSERDLLVYRGDPSWKYRKNLKARDAEIVKLEEELAKIDNLAPVVEGKPSFRLTEGNRNGTYPAPPVPGGEYRFCTEQKVDGFLTGVLSEYHGRIYLNIAVYSLYTRSYTFEDGVLFSSEDLNTAMDEISGRLAAAVSETLPSGILVHASPPDAMVLIDGSHVGLGETEMQTHSPGMAEIAVRADNHVAALVPLELNAGELVELYIDLTPLGLAALEAVVPDTPGSRVYMGSLFVGETPLALQLPRTAFSYISVETPDGKTGSIVYRDDELVKGSAQFVRSDDAQTAGRAVFNTKNPISPEEKRVDRARRNFYGTYGAFWIILPVTLLTASFARTFVDANNYVAASNIYADDINTKQKIYDRAVVAQYVQRGAYGVMGAALGVTFFQIFRYLYVSGGDATPIVKATASKEGTEP